MFFLLFLYAQSLIVNAGYSMKYGFLIGGVLIVIGLILQLIIGPLVWAVFAWPVNIVVLFVMLAVIIAAHLLRHKVHVFRLLSTYDTAIPALVYVAILTIVMGLIRQSDSGSWFDNMLTFWPFVLIYAYMTMILGLLVLRKTTSFSFLMFHLGLFMVLTTSTLGNADMKRLKMLVAVNEPEWCGLDREGRVTELPMAIELKRFIMEEYANHSPKRFASEVQIITQSGEKHDTIIEVNKPVSVDGWKIYQFGYDTRMGAKSRISIFELVRDSWQPFAYIGMGMMLCGALCILISGRRKRWLLLAAVAVAIVGLLKPEIYSSTLIPVLQSHWFAPHVTAYMFAYALMAVALVIALFVLIQGFKGTRVSVFNVDSVVFVGLAFLTIGMLLGAFWAKEAWGHYWAWDPKETWAAITWFSYLIYVHYRRRGPLAVRRAMWLLVVNFLLLQMCWWGINYLPSATGTSVHTYN